MNPASQRRRFAFSLRTLFLVVAAVGVWLGWNVYRVGERSRVQHDIAWRGAQILSPGFYNRRNGNAGAANQPALPWLWQLIGADPLGAILLPDNEFAEADLRRIQALFPEAVVTIEKYPIGSGHGVM
ncbi:MAG: hypothetical protein WD845_08700 [Pirellulales bacterium]